MNDILPLTTAEHIKTALAAEGKHLTDEQAQALARLIGLLGSVEVARIAVDIAAELEEAA